MATTAKTTIRASINDANETTIGHNGGPVLEGHKDPRYITVITRVHGKDIIVDTRICDVADFKARQWLVNKHIFWASSNGLSVATNPSSDAEVSDYTAKQAQLLARRYGK